MYSLELRKRFYNEKYITHTYEKKIQTERIKKPRANFENEHLRYQTHKMCIVQNQYINKIYINKKKLKIKKIKIKNTQVFSQTVSMHVKSFGSCVHTKII